MDGTILNSRLHIHCKTSAATGMARTLLLLVIASLGMGWFSPAAAHSQTTAAPNRPVCKAPANGLFLNQSYLEHTNFLFSPASVRMLAGGTCGPVTLAGRNAWSSLSLVSERSRTAAGFAFLNAGRAGMSDQRFGTLSLTRASANSVSHFTITSDTWVGHTGNWSLAGNWSTGIPTINNDVLITNSGSAVTEDINGSINNLTLSAGNTLSLNDAINLTIGGSTITNNGTITMNSTRDLTGLTMSGTVTLSGTGTVVFADSANPLNNYINGASGATLINQETIQGSGSIYQIALNNSGTIDADNADHGLTIAANGSGETNTGTLEATNGATLLVNGNIYNNKNGTIEALGGGTVQLQNVTIQGGQLTTDSGNGSLVETLSGSTVSLDGTTQGTLTNSGAFAVSNNSTLRLLGGTIDNTGSITLNGTLNRSNMILAASTTLAGSGTVTLADSGNVQNYIYGATGTEVLTNQQTIQGSGIIGNNSMALNNTGTINADNADNYLEINTNNGTTNTGTLEATNGATLYLASDTFNNTGGTIKATNGSTVGLFSNVTIQGGTLTTDSGKGSAIESVSGYSATLDGSTQGTLTNAGAYVVSNNSTTYLLGTINNTGSITLESAGNLSDLLMKGNTTLTGGGTVVLKPSAVNNNYLYGVTNTTQLTNVNNVISGAGTIGDGQLILVNESGGKIDANVAGQSLTISVSGNSAGTGVNGTNAGILESSASSSTLGPSYLVLNGGTINNTGGTIFAENGGVVQLDGGVTIQGGKLGTDTGKGSVIETVYGSNTLLDGSTQGTLTNSGAFSVVSNSTAFVKGTINNTGTMSLNSSYYNAILELAGNTTLQGTGTLTLADSANPQNLIYGQSGAFLLTNQQTIQGTGIIGDNSMALNNSGTIDADYADHGLEINTNNGSTNTGTLEATNGATLVLATDTFNNTGGTIKATGGSSVQLANGVVIEGGTLTTDAGKGSTIGTAYANSATLDGSTQGTLNNAGAYTVANNSTTYLKGTINNTGSITLNALGNSSYLELKGDTTLTGSGSIVMTPSSIPNNYFFGSSSTNTLTNTNNTISGAGNIGSASLIFVNHGKVNANAAGSALYVQVSGNSVGTGVNGTNTGVMESSTSNATQGPSYLVLEGGTFNNTGGTIFAENGGVVELYNGVTVQGGTLSTDTGKGSTIETVYGDRSILLDGTTKGVLTNSGAFAVTNNSTAFLTGAINNTGSISLNGTYYGSYLELAGNTTLSGAGTVTLTDSGYPQNFIFGQNAAYTLTNQQTIQGSGDIGNNSMGLINAGTIDANNADNGLEINTSNGTTNTGTLEATNGGTLQLATDTFNNKTGTIKATGASTVLLTNNVVIQGGTLSTDSTSKFEIPGATGATLDGTTQGTLNLAGALSVANDSTVYVKGAINNTGSITLNAAGYTTEMELTGNTTLTGAGTVTLANSPLPTNYIAAANASYVLTNQSNLIQGAGTIGNGQMGLVNDGTILSNTSSGLAIQPSSAGFTNNGTLQVASGSSMHVFGGPFTNFAGNTLTGGAYNVSGNLEIDQLGSSGGEITTNAANITLNGPTSIMVDSAGKDALSNLNMNAVGGIFTISGGRNYNTFGSFTNNGTLTVGSSNSKFVVTSSLTNFSGSTLTGGTYNVTGTLQFTGANIVTNAASIALTGSSSQIVDQNGHNALANFATNVSGANFSLSGGRNFTTTGNFTNNGTLAVASTSSMFTVNGNLSNFSGTTLTGGAYRLAGVLQFNGANIVTNDAYILLNGTSSKIQDQHGANGLANFATNDTAGTFLLQGGQTFTTLGNFTNKGAFSVGSGSTFTVGGTGTSYTQTAGTTTDDGNVDLPSTGALNVSAGSLLGKGDITGAVNSSGTVSPGDSSTTFGILKDTGAYTQNSSGVLDIGIGGTTAGTKYDQLNPTTASLKGTLTINLANGFVPTVGTQFKIMNFNSETGTFTTVNGLGINGSEHFTLAYQGTDVLLTVVSGALSSQPNTSGLHWPGPASVLGSPNLEGELHAGLTSNFIASALKGGPANSFRAAVANVMAAASTPSSQSNFILPENRTAVHAAASTLHFPSRIGASSSKTTTNNGAYGLHNRTVGAGFAFPMTHLSKPQMGLLVQ